MPESKKAALACYKKDLDELIVMLGDLLPQIRALFQSAKFRFTGKSKDSVVVITWDASSYDRRVFWAQRFYDFLRRKPCRYIRVGKKAKSLEDLSFNIDESSDLYSAISLVTNSKSRPDIACNVDAVELPYKACYGLRGRVL